MIQSFPLYTVERLDYSLPFCYRMQLRLSLILVSLMAMAGDAVKVSHRCERVRIKATKYRFRARVWKVR